MLIRRIIFLDIDGTLNDNTWKKDDFAPWILIQCAKNLNHIIQRTEAQVVLTSQRRIMLHSGRISLSGLQVLFKSHGITASLAGYLPYTENWEDKNFLIKDWLRINRWNRFVVLDDVKMNIENQVLLDGTIGLTEDNAQEAIEILNGTLDKPLPEGADEPNDSPFGIEITDE